MQKIHIDGYENIIIFGAGDGFILKWLLYKYKNKIKVIVDNNPQKWGSEKEGISVKGPSCLKEFNKANSIIILSLYKHWNEIQEQMDTIGWGNNLVIAKRDLEEISSLEFVLFIQNMSIDNYFPTVCNIELSGVCNCKCIYCPFHGIQNLKRDQKGLMEWDTLKLIAKQIKEISTIEKISTVGAGEVFIHPEWFEMTQYLLKETGVKKINMYTNGMLLNEKNVKKLVSLDTDVLNLEISIDGRTAQDNDHYRVGSNYEIIKNNINFLLKIKEKLNKEVNVIITNCYPIREEELKEVNNKHNLLYADVPEYLKNDFKDITIVSKNTYICKKENTEEDFGSLKIATVTWPDNYKKVCTNLFTRMAINYRGDLLRCSCGYAGIDGIGNVKNYDLYTLWKNDVEMNKARGHFVKGEKAPDMCEGCTGKGIGNYYLMLE